jgi:hypothetical protein
LSPAAKRGCFLVGLTAIIFLDNGLTAQILLTDREIAIAATRAYRLSIGSYYHWPRRLGRSYVLLSSGGMRMVDFGYFRAFDDVDGLVDSISACCKKRNVDPLSQEGQTLISLILTKRGSATVANYPTIRASQSERLSLISEAEIQR